MFTKPQCPGCSAFEKYQAPKVELPAQENFGMPFDGKMFTKPPLQCLGCERKMTPKKSNVIKSLSTNNRDGDVSNEDNVIIGDQNCIIEGSNSNKIKGDGNMVEGNRNLILGD